ncbi:MAG TPA: DUF983 domain-containing protein [Thermoanaerobaculia bacterium]|nr:DUF983 domain-containing protein [Thermoanaerobaculia bacterium]
MSPRSGRSFLQVISRGLRLRCPRCGEGRLFASWNHLLEACPVCGLEIERRLGDTWFFMYMSTAGLSGALVVAMFVIRPRVVWIGQILVCLAAIAIIGLSLPYRKGIAVALDYWIEGAGSGDGAAPGV